MRSERSRPWQPTPPSTSRHHHRQAATAIHPAHDPISPAATGRLYSSSTTQTTGWLAPPPPRTKLPLLPPPAPDLSFNNAANDAFGEFFNVDTPEVAVAAEGEEPNPLPPPIDAPTDADGAPALPQVAGVQRRQAQSVFADKFTKARRGPAIRGGRG